MSESKMMSMVEIDPNVRVRGNCTYAGWEDVTGPFEIGREVTVRESEGGVLGVGRVTQIDSERRLVYLSVDWAMLHVATQSELDKAIADAEWLAADAVVSPQPVWRLLIDGPQPPSGVTPVVFAWSQLWTPKTETSESGSALPGGGTWVLSPLLVGSH